MSIDHNSALKVSSNIHEIIGDWKFRNTMPAWSVRRLPLRSREALFFTILQFEMQSAEYGTGGGMRNLAPGRS